MTRRLLLAPLALLLTLASPEAIAQRATLAPPASGGNAGWSVSLDGDRAVVGARTASSGGTDTGVAYVYELSGGVWGLTATLEPTAGGSGDRFGTDVSLDGDRVVIGAVTSDANGVDSGAAYVFDLVGGAWSQTQRLVASGVSPGDLFGFSVSLSGDRALVGATGTDGTGADSGSAYVFELAGGAWVQTAQLTATDAASGDSFGRSVSLDGDRALVGALDTDGNGSSSGSAYIFDLASGVWNQTAELTAGDAASADLFGIAVDLDGDRALVGASRNDDGGNDAGSAYIFDLNGTWGQTAKLLASDRASNDQFGRQVALDGDRALVGGFLNDIRGTDTGSAYAFALRGTAWVQTAILTANDAASGDQLGQSVALDGERALVGAALASGGTGNAYVFELTRSAVLNGAQAYRMLAQPTGETYDALLGSLWTQGFAGSDAPGAGCSAFGYDETASSFAGGYTCLTDQNATWDRGRGAYVFVYEDDDRSTSAIDGGFPKTLRVDSPGFANEGAPFSAFPLSYTDNPNVPSVQEGWNLLGNPLTAGMDWNATLRSNGITPSIYVYDPNYLGGDYRMWTANTGGDLPGGIVPAFQAFFAQAVAPNPVMTVPVGAVVYPGPGAYGKASGETASPLRLELSHNGEPVSVAFVAAAPSAAIGPDALDAVRLTPGAWPRTVLSTRAVGGEHALSMNALAPEASGEIEVPLEIATEGHAEGDLALALSWSGALPIGWAATLVDRQMGTSTPLAEGGSYEFAMGTHAAKDRSAGLGVDTGLAPLAPKTGVVASSGNRFVLRITPAHATNTHSPEAASLSLGAPAPNPARGLVSLEYNLADAGEATLGVYDALGREVAVLARGKHEAGRHTAHFDTAALAPGVYVAQLRGGSAAVTQRFTVVR